MKNVMRLWLAAALLCAASNIASAQSQTKAAGLKRYVFVVLTNPVSGQEPQYNDWYTNVHLPDLVKIPGIKSAQRFRVAPENADPGAYKYLALYEIETNNLAAVQKAIGAAAGTPAMIISPALDRAKVSAIYFQELTEKVKQRTK